MPRYLVAFDKFKEALTASAVCAAAAQVLRDVDPVAEVDVCPLADGGDGFASVLTAAVGGAWRTVWATGPRGRPIEAGYGWVALEQIPADARALLGLENRAGWVAVIEMAQASGLARISAAERDPWCTSTFGTGEVVRDAVAQGASAIVLGLGGSATHDLGLGALTALGLRCATASGADVAPPVPVRWPEVVALRGSLDGLPPIYLACDVANPLLGPSGAAAAFAPQKGLRADAFDRLERETARMASQLCAYAGRPTTLVDTPGAGAAGGMAFGFLCAAGATLVSGAGLVAAWLDLERRLAEADVVITGEGRFDSSSLSGKGPGALVRRALDLGKPVHVFAGQVDNVEPMRGLQLHAITPKGVPLIDALAATEANLQRCVRAVFGAAR